MTVLTAAPLYRLRLVDVIRAGDVTPMMIFPIGEWHSQKYPDLPLTEDLATELIANFEAGVLGTEPVVDSSGRHDTSAPAAGWVKRVYLASYEEGDVAGLALWADVKWTALGAEMLTDEQYKYGSVEIGPVTMNDSGATFDSVLRSLTLTNTPVLRMMPGVEDAAEKQRSVVTLSLSELTLAGNPETAPGADGAPSEENPIDGLLTEFADWHGRLKGALKGSPGNSAVHTSIKACRDQLAQFCDGLKMAEAGSIEDRRQALKDALSERFAVGDETLYVSDFGPTWAVYNTWGGPSGDHYYRVDVADDGVGGLRFGTPAEVESVTSFVPLTTPESTDPADRGAGLSEPDSRRPTPGAKGDEGQPHAGARAPVAPKGADHHMITVIQKLNLAEDASEAIVLAEVTKLVERAETAEAKLAESEKAANAAAVKVRLDEALRLGEIDAAELTTLTEEDVGARDAFLKARKGVKHVDLTEHGQGSRDGKTELVEGGTVAGADKAYAEALRTYMAEHKLTGMKGRDEAREGLKREHPEIVTDYAAYLSEQHMGQLAQGSPSGDV